MISRRAIRVLPLALVFSAGCFATRNDVRLLQADVTRLHASAEESRRAAAEQARAEQLKRDSVHSAEFRQVTILNKLLADSLTHLSEEFTRFRARVSENDRQTNEQMMTLMEMMGASQKTIAAMRADAQREDRPVAASGGADSANAGAPSPRRMFQTGLDALRGGATSQARAAFQELMTTYKSDTLVAAALYWTAAAYASDKMMGAADSVYAIVVDQYPKSDRASNALLKRAEMLADAGKSREARAMYQRVISEYGRSPDADLARERIKQLPPS